MKHRFSIFFTTVILLVVAGVLILILSFVDPSSINAFGLLAVLAVVYLFFFCLFVFLCRIIELIIKFFGKSAGSKDKIRQKQTQRRMPYIVAALAFVPLFIVSLNSLGQVNFLNMSLVVIFEVLAIFYIIKRA